MCLLQVLESASALKRVRGTLHIALVENSMKISMTTMNSMSLNSRKHLRRKKFVE